MASLIFQDVSFSYPGSPAQLFDRVNFGVSYGWVGIVGANGAGKTTLLQLACGLLAVESGRIHRPARAAYCPQRTDAPPPELSSLLSSFDGEAYRIRGALEVEDDFIDRWDTLSHGERKRAQIAACLWKRPTLFTIDEPTNHLDARARSIVFDALRAFRGVGLLVSHDRELLDQLCTNSLFLFPPTAALRSGGYTDARARLDAENRDVLERKQQAARDRRRLRTEMAERRQRVKKAHKARSKRGIDRKDHDAKEKVDRARLADSGAGKNLRQLEGRLRQASEQEAALTVRKERATGISLHGRRSQRNALLTVGAIDLPLGEERVLRVPDLLVQPGDRIALIGPNGGGKSTLVRHILSGLRLPPEQVVSIPQEVRVEAASEVLGAVKALAGSQLGEVMQWVSRLGSDPHQLLDSLAPSPGEVRKLMLSLRMADAPVLLILDEPTNHMDLPSVECLESALTDYPGGLLLVSHDLRFLRALTTTTWEIVPSQGKGASSHMIVRRRPPEKEPIEPRAARHVLMKCVGKKEDRG